MISFLDDEGGANVVGWLGVEEVPLAIVVVDWEGANEGLLPDVAETALDLETVKVADPDCDVLEAEPALIK